jgi:protein-L-isoaspartate(D-aspartate) O-methyltransferase
MLSQIRKWLERPLTPDAQALAAARKRMVEYDLAGRGIKSQRALEAMARVPREAFTPPELQRQAYSDQALSIACDQTISQPYIVALMTEALEVQPHHRVLEIGTGSGYQTAVLAELAGEVVTVERHSELSQQAQETLQQLGYTNITFVVGDGTLGWPPKSPYDGILITAAAEHCPPALLEQLADGGRLVAPLGSLLQQVLQLIRRDGDQFHSQALSGCRFVPLIGEQGYRNASDFPREAE